MASQPDRSSIDFARKGLPSMQEIVFIADDFGLSEEVNQAIVHAHREGALTGTALMVGQSATDAAVELAHANPALEIGWHLHLVDSRPCTRDAWPWRASPARAGLTLGWSATERAAARREIEEQWDRFCATGLACRFVNAHHHLHLHPFVRRTVVEVLGDSFAGWLRWGRLEFFDRSFASTAYCILDRALMAPQRGRLPYRLSTTLWGIDRTHAMHAAEVRHAMANLGEGLHEFMFHPRRLHGDADTRCLIELADDS
jgi:predicted glycoside hydrolase/deacetylase ChbG (UPF0249 family)